MIDGPANIERGLLVRKVTTPTAGEIKINTIKRAGSEIGSHLDVDGRGGIPSKVPEQPFTIQLGFTGGKNRVDGLERDERQTDSEGLAIENFTEQVCIIGPDTNIWNGTMIHDIGAIVGKRRDGTYMLASSAGIRFPQHLYHEANKRGFSKHTVGEVLKEELLQNATNDEEIKGAEKVAKDPHRHYTGGAYGREDFLTLPVSIALMNDTTVQGRSIEHHLRERIKNSGVRLPNTMRILSTSTENVKNASITQVLSALDASSLVVEKHDGNVGDSSRQIMSLTDGFQAAYDRIEAIHTDGKLTRRPGDVTVSIQSCLIPVVLGAEVRYLDAATVLAERIDENGIPRYYSSVSAGTEFPSDSVRAALEEGVTVGKKIAEMYQCDPADPQIKLYGVSRQVILQEAVFAVFAQMNSGLEVQ